MVMVPPLCYQPTEWLLSVGGLLHKLPGSVGSYHHIYWRSCRLAEQKITGVEFFLVIIIIFLMQKDDTGKKKLGLSL